MIKIKYITPLLIFMMVIVFFVACKKTPDRPPINPAPSGGVVTISQLRNMFAANEGNNLKFTTDVSLYATVTMTDNYKTLYLRDNTGAISLKQLTAHGIYAGDSLRVNLNGAWLDLSGTSGSIQIDSIDVSSSSTNKVVKLAVGKLVTPITVSIAELNQSVTNYTYNANTGPFFVPNSIYDAQLVQINDAQFALVDSGNFINLSTGALFYNKNLYDCGALNSINISIFAQTADFLNQKVPTHNSGSIVAAVSFYNDKLQLTPRSFADLNFNQPRCGLPSIYQAFDTTAFGTGATLTAALFPGWVTLRQVGYSLYWAGTTDLVEFPSVSVYGSHDARNVVWLITPPMEYSSTKTLSFQASTTYNTSGINQLSVLVSTDFNGYNLGGVSGVQIGHMAHWTDITGSFSITTTGSSNQWVFQPAGNVVLSSTSAGALGNIFSGYTGTFYVGFRYTGVVANPDSAAGYGVNNVRINN